MWRQLESCTSTERRRDRGWRLLSWAPLLCCLLILLLLDCSSPSFASSPNSADCRPPCDNAVCPTVDGECTHGTYEFCNGCCTGCALGPDEVCHSHSPVFGRCGDGLICSEETLFYPGVCTRDPTQPTSSNDTTPSPSPSPSPSLSPSPSPTPSPISPTNSTTTVEPPTDDCTGDETTECRPLCSVEFCSERATRKKRICSATGLSTVVQWNKCQHTSCGACFLLREPNCTRFACPVSPMKDCLRRFYVCVRDHYFGPTATSNLIKLEDPLALTTPGRVVCLVPPVNQDPCTPGSPQGDQNGST